MAFHIISRLFVKRILRNLFWCSLLLLGLSAAVQGQTDHYVNASAMGSNTGIDWDNAFTDLQDALGVATTGDRIFVAAGTYKPSQQYNFATGATSTGDVRAASFKIPDGVEVYGGFPAAATGTVTAADIAARNFTTDETILSGDLDNNNAISGSDAYHVVFTKNVSSTTVVDGFTIAGGNADESSSPNNRGAGWYNDGSGAGNVSNPTLRNCSFLGNNAASRGGGMYNYGFSGTSSPSLTNCSFSGNVASFGGGMFNNGVVGGTSSPSLNNCSFSGNNAAGSGGGMYNYGISGGTSSPLIRNSIFWDNTGTGQSWFNVSATPDVAYTLVSEASTATITTGDYTGTTVGAGMIYAQDPLFTNAASGALTLEPCSPAIDAGSSATISLTEDAAGNPRVRGGEVDMGAFEATPTPLPEIALSGTGTTNFGNVVTSTSQTLSYTISNSGAGTLNITGISVSGSTDFSLSNTPTTVASSSSETFEVVFTPSATGTSSATITVASNDCDEPSLSFGVSGTGFIPSSAPEGTRGAYFDGDDRITAALPTTATDNFTISAWVKWQEAATSTVVFYNGNFVPGSSSGYGLVVDDGGQVEVAIGFGPGFGRLETDVILNINEWTYLSLVRDAGVWRVYANGTAAGFTSGDPTAAFNAPATPTGSFYLGSPAAGRQSLIGQLDEVRVFNSVRSIANLNRDRSSTTTNGAVAFWRLENGTGTNAADATTSYNGTFAAGTNQPLWAHRVINTNDAGAGSLRQAITDANSDGDKDYIDFSISGAAPWDIALASQINGFQGVTQPTIIDGTSQLGWQNNTVDGLVTISRAGGQSFGLLVDGDEVEIYGLKFTGFAWNLNINFNATNFQIGATGKGNVFNQYTSFGLDIAGATGQVIDNKFGTDETGTTSAMPGDNTALRVGVFSAGSVTIENNVMARGGIFLGGGQNNVIRGNRIGTGITGNETGLGVTTGSQNGITVNGAGSTLIENNVIGNFDQQGVQVANGASNTTIRNNNLGIGADNTTDLGNVSYGLRVTSSAANPSNTIIEGNRITFNDQGGIWVQTEGNRITENLIYCNSFRSITLNVSPPNGNLNKAAPTITKITTSEISGICTTCADGETIEVFRDDSGCSPNGGTAFLGTATVSSNAWSLSGAFTTTNTFTATATDATGNTSPFGGFVPTPDISVTNTAAGNFGNVFVGASTSLSYTIENTGTAALDVSSISVSPSAVFGVTPTAANLPVGATQTFTLTFSPSVTGTTNGTVTLISNDPNESPLTFSVSGTGTPAPELNLSGTSTTNFGNVSVGESGTFTYTVGNTGGATLTITTVSVSGSTDIAASPTTTINIPPGGSTTLTLSFTPSLTGTTSATLTLTTNDPATPTISVGVSGTGITPELSLPLTTSTDFGDVTVGVSSTQSYVIENTGSATLTVTSISSDNGDFVPTPTNLTLPAGASASVDVTFTPSSTGTANATITLTSDDLSDPTVTFGVSGTGTYPELVLDPSVSGTANVGSVVVSESGTLTFTVSNSGTVPLEIENLIASNPDFTVSPTGTTIAGGTSQTFTVVFTPSSTGTASSTISFDTNDPNNPTVDVEVEATGITPEVNLPLTTSTDFGDVTVGVSSTQSYVIENTGSATLTVTSITSDNGDFVPTPTNLTLPAGASATVDLTFTPSSTGTANATITLTSDDLSDPTVTFGVSGTGTYPELVLDPSVSGTANVGAVVVSESGTLTFTVSNSGTVPLEIENLISSNPDFTVSPTGTTIAGGTSQTFTVVFTPSATGTASSTISFDTNDPNNPTVDIEVEATGITPEVSLPLTTNTDFGDLTVGVSSTQSYVIENTGSATLTVTSITSDNGDFVPSPTNLTLPAGASASVDVTFTPSSTGTANATITLTSNDLSDPTVSFGVSGTGTYPELVLDPSVSGTANVGSVVVSESGTLTFTVSNSGTVPLEIENLISSNPDFTVSPTGTTIAGGTSQTFTVVFTPSATGTASSTISFDTNDPNNPTVAIEVEATGITPEVSLPLTTSTDFGDLTVGVSSTQSYVIENTGSATLTVTSITSDNGDFVPTPTNLTLPAGASGSVDVSFTPSSTGTANATITLTSDDLSDPTVSFGVSGTGTYPALVLDPSVSGTANVGAVVVSESGTLTFTVSNSGTVPLEIENLISSNPDFTVSPTGTTIAGGTSQTFTVVFTPSSTGTASSTISFDTNDPNNPTVDIEVEATGITPEVNFPLTTSTDFGDVTVGVSSTQSYVIENTGSATLTVTSISSDNGDFVPSPTNLTLPAGASASVDVTFTPSSTGTANATITLTSDDLSDPTVTFGVSGTGTYPALVLDPSVSGTANVGSVVVSESGTLTFTVNNSGTVPLEIDNLISSNPDFTVSPTGTTIAGGTSQTFTVVFTPSSTGTASSTISFDTNDPNNPTVDVEVEATGITPEVSLPLTTSTNFGDVTVGVSSTQSYVIENTGSATLTVTSISSDNGDFVPSPTNLTLPAGASASVDVTFTPSSTGTANATITLTSDDLSDPTVTFGVSGTGTYPELVLDPSVSSTANVGSVVVSESGTLTFTVSNSGTVPLEIENLISSNPDFTVSPTGTTIAGGTSQTFTVVFTPSATGTASSTISFDTNDPNNPTVDIEVEATGITPEITLPLVTSTDFGDVTVGVSSTQSYVIENTGSATLTVTSITSDNGDFVPTPTNLTLPAGASTSVDVTFTPSAVGNPSATITLVSDDLDEPTLNVNLSGTGVPEITAGLSSSVCGNTSQTLTITTGDSYLWSTGATAQDITIAPTVTTTYSATVTTGGFAAAASITIVVESVAPTVLTQNVTVSLDASGSASITAAMIDNGSTDNCGITSLTLDQTTFTCADAGTNTVSLTATDAAGNAATGTATVTVEDNILPTPVAQNATVQLDASGSASITAAMIDNGSSDNCGIASLAVTPTTFTCADAGANTVTLTVTDVNGNVSTTTAMVTINLPPDPVVTPAAATTCAGSDVTISASGGLSYLWSNGATSTSITVAPTTTTTYSLVAATAPGGCQGSASMTVTVNPLPVVSITGTLGIAAGTSTTLSATGTAGVSYQWNTGSTATSIVVTPTGTTSYSVLGTDVNGCQSVDTVTVIPRSASIAPAPIAPSDLTATGLSTSTIRLDWTDLSDNEIRYDIYRAPVTARTLSKIAEIPAGSGEMVYFDSAGLEADTRYTYQVVAVGSLLSGRSNTADGATYPFAPQVVSTTTGCAGGTAQAIVSGDQASEQFLWYTDSAGTNQITNFDGTAFTGNTLEVSRMAGTYTFYVSTVGVKYESTPLTPVSLTFNPIPEAVILDTLGGQSGRSCDETVTLIAQEVPNATYTWTVNGNFIGTGRTITGTVEGDYRVTVTLNGCSAISEAVAVNLNYAPPVRLNVSDNVSFCESGEIAVNEIPGAIYGWTRDGNNLGVTTPVLTVTESGEYRAIVTVDGCPAESVGINVTIDNPTPNQPIELTAEATTLCPGERTTLSVTPISGATYQWFRNGNLIETSANTTLETGIPGRYVVSAQLPGVCGTTISSDALSLEVFETPDARLKRDADNAETLVIEILGTVTVQNIVWTFNGEEVAQFAGQQTITPTEEGTYLAFVTYTTGCTVFTNGFRYFEANEPGDGGLPTGTDEESTELTLYPNPTNGAFLLQLPNSWTGETTVELTDNLGRVLETQTFGESQKTLRLSLKGYPAGTYFVRLKTEAGSFVRKVVRQ